MEQFGDWKVFKIRAARVVNLIRLSPSPGGARGYCNNNYLAMPS
jgi:hypothetical protein